MHKSTIIDRAQVRHYCLNNFFKLYNAWGYRFIHLPLIDNLQYYQDSHFQDLLRASYRFTNNVGDIMLLRPDMTLFLMHNVSPTLPPTPHRLWYADSVARPQNSDDTAVEDIFQSGAEIVNIPPGIAAIDCDVEIILLCNEITQAVGVPGARTHIGSRALFNCYFDSLVDRDIKMYHTLQRAVRECNAVELRAIIEEANKVMNRYNPSARNELATLFQYRGDVDLLRLPGVNYPPAHQRAKEAYADMVRVVKTLQQCVDSAYVLDLSEIGSYSYYSGVCFSLYADGAGSAIATGGHYQVRDSIRVHPVSTFPSAVGCTFTLNTIEELVASGITPTPVAAAHGSSIVERYRYAQAQRLDGTPMHL